MPLLDVLFPFLRQLDIPAKPRAWEAACRVGVRHPSWLSRTREGANAQRLIRSAFGVAWCAPKHDPCRRY